jgi:hypothetical protein
MFLMSQAHSPELQYSSYPGNLLACMCNKPGGLVYKHVFGEVLKAPDN